MSERETRIREWAYRLWEQDGYPHGRDGEHWFRAVAIVMEEDGLPEPEAAEAAPESVSEAAPETTPEPAPEAAAKPKAAKAKKASAGATITETPAPAPVPPARRKRS
ncbi:DUF2934 domain-containing protein [Ancylobacter dichloromethanicus]|uniref:DUF2934 domain-containing protein n=1 Tax=Ancylobacter dichloromethanicus TaxID=518825 RepID=A0A9W6MXG7_9HYPH|nr:DUF2934 domain-containing protein [Ancylobacter dichloromethanicus]MBS7556256.1 DUF2934 domain-containing protein [Ancylobacter dichloromethanicus]GLK70016.1 hypothetical protein GCM10017643_01310 [Ancylobacter dichloromethanicus]